jgi:nitrite reductase (NO-forming)
MKKILIFLLLSITVLMAGCSTQSEANVDSTQTLPESNSDDTVVETSPEIPVNENEVEETTDEVLVIELDAFSFGYSVEEIRATVGQKVRVVMTNTGGRHDFVIDELNARTSIIGAGETTEATFTVTEAGEFEYYCSVGSHRAAGMVGTLIVEE